jgi:hypothetical protein
MRKYFYGFKVHAIAKADGITVEFAMHPGHSESARSSKLKYLMIV